LEYWNSTASLTGTGRPADALIAPLAPFAAARPARYDYYGYTVIVNVLDYTATTIPVTVVEKEIDVVDDTFKPLNEIDQKVFESCEQSFPSS
jgi:amidase